MYRFSLILLLLLPALLQAQPAPSAQIHITVLDRNKAPLQNATVEMLRAADSSTVLSKTTGADGKVFFDAPPDGAYIVKVSMVNHQTQFTVPVQIAGNAKMVYELPPIVMTVTDALLQSVTVSGQRSFMKVLADKTIINVDASITSAGSTIMEVLERSPGVSVTRDGNISLKGKPGVLILIDGKPTYMTGADLVTLLNGMSSSQVDQIELMDNPPARYDASGTAGVINIKTKKNKQQGFNGTLTLSYGQGMYPKSNNALILNYRSAKINAYLNYTLNASQFITDMFALRTYFAADNKTVLQQLYQPYFFLNNSYTHNLKTGIDYTLSKKTSLGLGFTGTHLTRFGDGSSEAQWQQPDGKTDSVILGTNEAGVQTENAGVNVNIRHVFNSSQELSADVDVLGYKIRNFQYFGNRRNEPGALTEATEGVLPTKINILAAKADYTQKWKTLRWDAGWKSSRVNTDNNAFYYLGDEKVRVPDPNRTNHFIYREHIHALYSNAEKTLGDVTVQAGLRYEYTAYDASQVGSSVKKDSTYTRKYHSLFPTVFFTWKADSANSFTFSAGRRIDRPAFQKLNPFVFMINKYTNMSGNPYLRPQYTWNIGVGHQYKEWLSTNVSYSRISDYISQQFLVDSNGTFLYAQGNTGSIENIGLSVSVQLKPLEWWSVMGQADLVHKHFKGFVWRQFDVSILQLSLNLNNQFRFKRGWGAEVTAYYITKNQEDMQEVLEPNGQIGIGISKQVLKNKATLKLNARDIFYTQKMAGLTQFQQSQEYFKLLRDSRVITLAFIWRFGRSIKAATRRTSGADDEIKRADAS